MFYNIYRKPPNISSGLIFVRKHFLVGLYMGGLYSEGLIFGGLRYLSWNTGYKRYFNLSLPNITVTQQLKCV